MTESDVELLEIRYVPLSTVATWEANPKLHDVGGICESISRYGFGDPPKYDAALGALVYGNGRIEALAELRSSSQPPPRGVRAGEGDHAEDWLVPVVFGVDQGSAEMAERFALDHNSLTLGPRFDATDVQKLWKNEAVTRVARGWTEAARTLVVPVPAAQKANTRRASPNSTNKSVPGPAFAAKCQERWQVEVGARYRVGPFVLACGDARDEAVVTPLLELAELDPQKAVVVVDPPPTSGTKSTKNGALSASEHADLLIAVLKLVQSPSSYVFCDWAAWTPVKELVEGDGMTARAMLVWDQGKPEAGGLWREAHQLVMWATRGSFRRRLRRPTIGNVLHHERVENKHHPGGPTAEKPVDLLVAILQNDGIAGRQRAPVYDPMVGSSSSLLAAARHGRGGLGLDVNPLCIAASLTRLQDELGEDPEVLES